MRIFFFNRSELFFFIGSFFLISCGQLVKTPPTLSGLVQVTGPVSNATIEVYALDEKGNRLGHPLEISSTDSEGKYALKTSLAFNPRVEIVALGKDKGKTTYTDGNTSKILEPSDSLTAIVESSSSIQGQSAFIPVNLLSTYVSVQVVKAFRERGSSAGLAQERKTAIAQAAAKFCVTPEAVESVPAASDLGVNGISSPTKNQRLAAFATISYSEYIKQFGSGSMNPIEGVRMIASQALVNQSSEPDSQSFVEQWDSKMPEVRSQLDWLGEFAAIKNEVETCLAGSSPNEDPGSSPLEISFSAQPSDQTASSEGVASFTVIASVPTGSTLSYQWEKKEAEGSDFIQVEGAHGSTLELTGLSYTPDNGDFYRVVVSISDTDVSVASSVALLTVLRSCNDSDYNSGICTNDGYCRNPDGCSCKLYEEIDEGAFCDFSEDTLPPTANSITIDDGTGLSSAAGPSYSATLGLSASDNVGVTEMKISMGSSICSGGTWESYTTNKTISLTPNTVNQVSVQFRDGAENVSACLSASTTHSDPPETNAGAENNSCTECSLYSSTYIDSWCAQYRDSAYSDGNTEEGDAAFSMCSDAHQSVNTCKQSATTQQECQDCINEGTNSGWVTPSEATWTNTCSDSDCMSSDNSVSSCAGDCYDGAQSLAIGTQRQGPDSTLMSLEYANGVGGFKIWKEKCGNRILNSSGLISNGWQKELTRAGTAFNTTDFTTGTNIAGRVCPPNVFLSHSNMTATGYCLYYDAGETEQALDQDADTVGEERLVNWDDSGSGRGVGSSYYEGNIKTCADKGMRLPTLYETAIDQTALNEPFQGSSETFGDYLPDGDGIMPQWAGPLNGVPIDSPLPTWTASAGTTSPGYINSSYWVWYQNIVSYDWGAYYDSAMVKCVLPSSHGVGEDPPPPEDPASSDPGAGGEDAPICENAEDVDGTTCCAQITTRDQTSFNESCNSVTFPTSDPADPAYEIGNCYYFCDDPP